MPQRAVILSGSLGMGHDVVSDVVSASLAGLGWQARTLDCMALLGPRASWAGDWVFRRLMARPGIYDGLHFAHLRTGSRLATAMDRAATPRLVSALREVVAAERADMIISVFAAGVPAVAGLAAAWRRRGVWRLALLWLGACLLALGPTLHVGGGYYVPLAQRWSGVRVSGLMPFKVWNAQLFEPGTCGN